MPKQKKKTDPTPQEQEIERIRKVPKEKRTPDMIARLSQLVEAEKRTRFLRLAPARVQKLIDAVDRLSACGNGASYQYNEHEAAKIVAAVKEAAATVEDAFTVNRSERPTFSL